MKCISPDCNNESAKGRKLCWKCKSRKAKIDNPYFYYYNLLRCNANRRNKEFTLTFQEFKNLCNKTQYLELKGRNGNDLSIDRIDLDKGYSIDNLRVVTKSVNSKLNVGTLESWMIPDNEETPF